MGPGSLQTAEEGMGLVGFLNIRFVGNRTQAWGQGHRQVDELAGESSLPPMTWTRGIRVLQESTDPSVYRDGPLLGPLG